MHVHSYRADNDSGWLKRSSGLAISVQTQADVQAHSKGLDSICCVLGNISYLSFFFAIWCSWNTKQVLFITLTFAVLSL